MKSLIALLVLSLASAQAVILYRTGDPTANTTEPTATGYANSGWQFEGDWGPFLGTPIAPHFFISARHLGLGAGTFVYQGVNYQANESFIDPQSDLLIWRVVEEFPSFAPLYSRTEEIGKRLIAIGRGTQRGADEIPPGSTFRGWRWGASDSVRRWGENIVSSIYPNGPNNDLLRAEFNENGLPNECHLSSGDSGGAAFIQDGAEWKLAGIHYSVDGHFSYDSLGSNAFDAALFDTSGLYVGDESTPYTPTTGPSALYPSRISTKLPWISRVVAEPKPGREGDYFTLTYTKFILPATDVSYTVQQSTDLIDWQTAGATDEVLSTTGSTRIVKSKVPIIPGDGALFLRLQVARP